MTRPDCSQSHAAEVASELAMAMPWLLQVVLRAATCINEYHTLLHAEAHSMQPTQRTCWCRALAKIWTHTHERTQWPSS